MVLTFVRLEDPVPQQQKQQQIHAPSNTRRSSVSLIITASQDGVEATTDAICLTECGALGYIRQVIRHATVGQTLLLKFVIPVQPGYIVRGDWIEERMRFCKLSAVAESFVCPGQFCGGEPARASDHHPGRRLACLFQASAGVVQAADLDLGMMLPQSLVTKLLDDEMAQRLAWPWTVPESVKPRRVVIVGEKRAPQECERFYQASKGCGVSIVVMDRPGHWMEDPDGPGKTRREHFVQFSGFTFNTLTDRVVEAVRALPYHVDGIFSTMDALHAGVAQAAEILGLPTVGSEAFRKATNKFDTRQMQKTAFMTLISNVDELKSRLHEGDDQHTLQYPLIVKPTHSDGSYGVSKAANERELHAAVHHAIESTRNRHTNVFGSLEADTKVVIETYCEGPEVDVNFVLWDGELLFSEVVDNFPCVGDEAESGSRKTESFVETGSMWPSGLPPEEWDILRAELLRIVRDLGIHTGVVHVEAKVHNSAVEWRRDSFGIIDLCPRSPSRGGQAASFLLEVNPRPPGQSDSTGSVYVHGVDYYALYLMQVIGDEARFRSLAQAFVQGPQFHCATMPLAIHATGRMLSDMNIKKTSRQAPEIEANMIELRSFFKAGDVVPEPEKLRLPWLGFAMMCSRRGRRDLLEKLAYAQDNIDWDIEPQQS